MQRRTLKFSRDYLTCFPFPLFPRTTSMQVIRFWRSKKYFFQLVPAFLLFVKTGVWKPALHFFFVVSSWFFREFCLSPFYGCMRKKKRFATTISGLLKDSSKLAWPSLGDQAWFSVFFSSLRYVIPFLDIMREFYISNWFSPRIPEGWAKEGLLAWEDGRGWKFSPRAVSCETS